MPEKPYRWRTRMTAKDRARLKELEPTAADVLRYETALQICGLSDGGRVNMTTVEKVLRDYENKLDVVRDRAACSTTSSAKG